MMKSRLLLLVLFWCLAFPVAVSATPVFKYDTHYDLSGKFHFGFVGEVHIAENSFLYYDSEHKVLTIEANVVSNRGNYQGGQFELDFLLGEAMLKNNSQPTQSGISLTKSNSKVEFKYHPDAMIKDKMHQIGEFTAVNASGKHGVKFPAGYESLILSKNMNPLIGVDKNRLYFQAWLGIWGQTNRKWDIHSDPKFYLTERPTPPVTSVPEPFTLGLLLTGLLGGVAMRRKSA